MRRSLFRKGHKCVSVHGRTPCVADNTSRFSDLCHRCNMRTSLRSSEWQCAPAGNGGVEMRASRKAVRMGYCDDMSTNLNLAGIFEQGRTFAMQS